MYGFPKTLNTKEDYEYIRTHFRKEEWSPCFQALLDTQFNWFFEKELTEEEKGNEDEFHKIEKDDQSGKRYQFVYKIDSNCKLYSLGYTEQEVKEFLAF